LSFYHE